MWRWWETKKGAWADLAIGAGVGGIMTYLSPQFGIPLCIALIVLGFIFLKRAYKLPAIDFHAWGTGISGYRGYPKEPDGKWWLYLEVSIDQTSRLIDTLDLLIEDDRIPVNLPCKFGAMFNVYFEVTKWRSMGKHQVELVAKVGKETISSGRKMIDIDMEPFGRLLI